MDIPAEFTITTAEQSQNIDADTTGKFGIDSFTLMEIAGSSAAKNIRRQVEPGDRGIFLCGKGNNGGDAQVVARYLAQLGIEITLVFISGTDDLSPDAEKNFNLLQSIEDQNSAVHLNFTNWSDFDQAVRPDFIIDGMLGTGLDSNLRGNYTDAVNWANQQPCPIFAMDIPTGLHADSGKIMGNAIKADQTFAFGTRKQGFYLGDGYEYVGEVVFCELPFPNHFIQRYSSHLIDENWVSPYQSKPARHKYEAGVVHIIAGSEGLTGAAMMAAKSAWAQGVGAVILICPRGALQIFENNLPQIIKKPVGQRDENYFKYDHLQEVSRIISQKKGPVLIGPGLGRKESTVEFVNNLLAETRRSFIIDADALWAISQQAEWEKPEESEWILTPHPGELSRLFDVDINNDLQRLNEVKTQAHRKDITLLSKGYPVILGTPDKHIYLSGYDTRKFSRAGFGDVLAGKTAAFTALGCPPAESCIRALIDGNKKAVAALKNNAAPLEPFDLI
ncbi:MAG TPA: NAD(P)H-hydrate dehydratase [Balneolaceae bacterium]|nr:NAD(P)H-hydrate dehydratase [Balneolaceae bacterium]